MLRYTQDVVLKIDANDEVGYFLDKENSVTKLLGSVKLININEVVLAIH